MIRQRRQKRRALSNIVGALLLMGIVVGGGALAYTVFMQQATVASIDDALQVREIKIVTNNNPDIAPVVTATVRNIGDTEVTDLRLHLDIAPPTDAKFMGKTTTNPPTVNKGHTIDANGAISTTTALADNDKFQALFTPHSINPTQAAALSLVSIQTDDTSASTCSTAPCPYIGLNTGQTVAYTVIGETAGGSIAQVSGSVFVTLS